MEDTAPESHGTTCRKCGAWRGAFGLEPTVEMYVAHTVEILREVRRVLRPDGVCFWNIGDSYFNCTYIREKGSDAFGNAAGYSAAQGGGVGGGKRRSAAAAASGLKQKDLCLIPERVVLAAQADVSVRNGKIEAWWVRSRIIWAKPNPMPESTRDRPTDAYEHILMLTKSARYFWDADAVRESAGENTHPRGYGDGGPKASERGSYEGWADGTREVLGSRNLRNVWTFATQPYAGAHFATFPEELPRICIKAATSAKGACAQCGAPWARVTESQTHFEGGSGRAMLKLPHDGETASAYEKDSNANRLALLRQAARDRGFEYGRQPASWKGSVFDTGKTAEHQGQRMQLRTGKHADSAQAESGDYDIRMGPVVESRTIGWRPGCRCGGHDVRQAGCFSKRLNREWYRRRWQVRLEDDWPKTIPCVVLDPFAGSGTVGRVAIELNRRAILVDLAYTRATPKDIKKKREYDRLAHKRTRNVQRNLNL